MLIDGRSLTQATPLQADICIVGAGAAGLTLAQALDGAPFSVLLIESGGLREEAKIQSLADGTSEEPYPFLDSRARCFGGTTSRWSGACIPLDPGDFEAAAWLPHSGWPFPHSALLPYYRRAFDIFGLPEALPPIDATPFGKAPLSAKCVGYSHPLDLGRKYRQQILRSQNVTLVTHATVTELVPDDEVRCVQELYLKSPEGQDLVVHPKTAILATGGIENARLLLASTRHCSNGLGNDHDLVGRFFMEHYYKVVGILPLGQRRRDVLPFTNVSPLGQSSDQSYGQGTFGLTDALRHQHHLLNMHLRFYRYSPLEGTSAVIAAKRLGKAANSRDFKAIAAAGRRLLEKDWRVLPRYLGWHLWNKFDETAKFTHVRLQAWLEQEPDPSNRVTLSSERDYLGQPLAHLRLRCSDRMMQSVTRSLKHIDAALQSRGFGPLQYDTARLAHLNPYDKIGLHHMGTTRMHPNPTQGVVDANCKVHSLANLYLAGSSVFPTGGAANPTLTIAALALRLADHIQTRKEI